VTDFEIDGRLAEDPHPFTARLFNVTPGYFRALRVPILEGRGFTADDRLGHTPVVVIDAELARRYWPEGRAVGRRLRLGTTLGADTAWREVVGIVGAVRAAGLERSLEPTIHVPHTQNPWPSMSLVIGASGLADGIARAAAAEVHALDPSRPVYNVLSLNDTVTRLLAPRRLQSLLMGAFAAAALALAALGVYGMLSNAVVGRTRELGVRMALGAQRGDILRLCLGRGLARIGAGTALGAVGAALATRLSAGVLFGLAPWDPVTYGAAITLVLVAGFAASIVPAWRAAWLDPVAALWRQ
jgi:putative ABC transport system permease protein